MKTKTFALLVAAFLLLTVLVGCGKSKEAPETAASAAAEARSEAPQNIPEESPALPDGMWQTASVTMDAEGNMAPERYVRFADGFIVYGHMKDGAFAEDHRDRIVSLAETASGGVQIQAEASNGVQYSYRTCESDQDVLEYFETWDEAAFPEAYRGGASLSRSA